MTRHSRRAFLRIASVTAAGASVALQSPSPLIVAAAPGAAKPVTFSYINLWDTKVDAHYPALHYLYKAFKAKHPEISIKETVDPNDTSKAKTDCAAGACPDLMNDIDETFWADKLVLDLMPYLKADPAWASVFDQQALAFTRTNGYQWALCNELSPICMVWHTKVLEQAGVGSVPTTWAEFLAACDKIKRSGKIPFSFQAGGQHMFHDILIGLKGGYQALAANSFDAPPFLEAFKRVKLFVDNKWLARNDIELSFQQAFANFQAGRMAFIMDGMWTIKNTILAPGVPADLRNHVAFSAFPAIDRGTIIEKKVSTIVGVSHSLPTQPDRLNAVITFLKFWFSPAVAARWAELCWSPMGVTLDPKTLEGLPALPKAWLAARDRATTQYVLPATLAMQVHEWDDFIVSNAQTLLLQGKSAEAALKAYRTFLAPYVKK